MTRYRQRTFVCAASLIAAAVLIAIVLFGYPVLHEKWHISRLGSQSYLERKSACEALGKIGTARCVPALFERLVAEASTNPPRERQCSRDVVPFYGSAAAIYWGALLDLGEAAMPYLLRELKSDDAGRSPWAADVLGYIGAGALTRRLEELGEVVPYYDGEYELDPAPEAVGSVVSALTGAASDPDESSALEAIEGLGGLGPVARPALRQAFESAGGHVREAAARALVEFDPDAATLAVLEKAKLDPSAHVRQIVVLAHRDALNALTDPDASPDANTAEEPAPGAEEAHGPSPEEIARRSAAREAARDKLEEILAAQVQASDAECRESALRELADLGPRRATTVALATAALKAPEAIVRGAAAGALSSAKGAARSVVLPPLLDALRDSEASVRAAAAAAVTSLEGGVEAAAGDLIPLLKDEEAGPIVLNAFVSAPIKVVPALLKALQGDDVEIQRHAAVALGRIAAGPDRGGCSLGEHADTVLGALEAHLRATDPEACRSIAAAVGRVSYCLRRDLSRIAALLEDDSSQRRLGALDALRDFHNSDIETRATLCLKMLASHDPEVQEAAARALPTGNLADTATVLPVLLETLARTSTPRVAAAVVSAIDRLGGSAAAAVPLLERLLRDSPDAPVRANSLSALSTIKGPHAPELDPDLVAGLRDSTPRVRAAAMECLRFRPDTREAMEPTLAAALKALISPSDTEADEAVYLIDRLGGWTAPDMPFLFATLSAAPTWELEGVMTSVLVKLCETDPSQVSRLVEALGDSKTRRHAIRVLAELGPAAKTAAPLLRALAQAGPADEQAAAAWALEAVEPPPPAAEEAEASDADL